MTAKTERNRGFKEQMPNKHITIFTYLGYSAYFSNLVTYNLLPVTKGYTNITMIIKWKTMKLAGHVTSMTEVRNAYTILVREPRRRWEYSIKTDCK